MATDPSAPGSGDPAAPPPRQARPAAPPSEAGRSDPRHTRTARTYGFLVGGALVTLALVVFIVQNLAASPEVSFLGWSYSLPIGINMLIAALAGALVTGLVGAVRMVQLRRALRRA